MVADINYKGLVGMSVGVERERRSEAAGRAVAGYPSAAHTRHGPDCHSRAPMSSSTSRSLTQPARIGE